MSHPARLTLSWGTAAIARLLSLQWYAFAIAEDTLTISLFRCWNTTSPTNARPDLVSSNHAHIRTIRMQKYLAIENHFILLLYNHSVSIIIEISFEIFSLICYKSNALIVFGEYE